MGFGKAYKSAGRSPKDAAFGWGAVHALSPGHGKAMVAAYGAIANGGGFIEPVLVVRVEDRTGKTLHGMTVNGFPNCFIFSTVQSGFTANYPHALAEQSQHAAHIIVEAVGRQKTRVEPTVEAVEAWTQEVLDAVLDRRKFLEECTPGYYNGEGQLNPLAASFSPYGKGSVAFFGILAEWRDEGSLRGLTLD